MVVPVASQHAMALYTVTRVVDVVVRTLQESRDDLVSRFFSHLTMQRINRVLATRAV